MTANDESGPGEYSIGHGKPPRHTQFKKGQSGNPSGRPSSNKGKLPPLSLLVSQALDEIIEVNDGGRHVKMTLVHLMVRQLVDSAVGGNNRALRALIQLRDFTFEVGNLGPTKIFLSEFESMALGEPYASRYRARLQAKVAEWKAKQKED